VHGERVKPSSAGAARFQAALATTFWMKPVMAAA